MAATLSGPEPVEMRSGPLGVRIGRVTPLTVSVSRPPT